MGRRSSASVPLPVSTSVSSRARVKPSVSQNRSTAARCASRPRPERPCRAVLNPVVGDDLRGAEHRVKSLVMSDTSDDTAVSAATERLLLISYARVSTEDQDPQYQLDVLKAAGCVQVFQDRASGATLSRAALDQALAARLHARRLEAGSRRPHWLETVRTIVDLDRRGIEFRSLTESFDRMAVPMECELLVLVGEGAAGEPDPHHVVVEGGDLGPALPHLGADQFGMPAGREDGVGDVVEHDAVLAPQHHHGHGGAEQSRGRGPEALRPSVDGAERGLGPVPRRDKLAAAAAGEQSVAKSIGPGVGQGRPLEDGIERRGAEHPAYGIHEKRSGADPLHALSSKTALCVGCNGRKRSKGHRACTRADDRYPIH
ncbi:recombinase family protein [Methylorubrum sp. B1-46]|uniref:recombinase family protein n=1 Tax=Methylorubrum sp. B1-46 TaxID=2897334 RepID=UPI00351D98C8